MLIERIIYARLIQDATLMNLVNDKIYPETPKNITPPFLKYTCTNTATTMNLTEACALEIHTIAIEVYSATKIAVDTICHQVKEVLHGYRGGQVKLCKLESYNDLNLEDTIQGCQLIFTVWQNTEVLSSIIYVTRGSSKVVTLKNLTDTDTGDLVNDATVTGEVFDEDENSVHTFTLPYVSPGKYQNTISAVETATWNLNLYTLVVTAVAPDGTKIFTAQIRVS
jgi:hypothetical protein